MSKLACFGGKPISKDFSIKSKLISRYDLEKKYLLQVHKSRVWDDWPGVKSIASKFQHDWASFNNSRFCALLTNGTHTLQIALEALDIGFGDEVIVPGLTWQATASAVCDVNAIPILVDVDPTTLCIDVKKIEQAITSRTRAIIPVHLYNRMADMDKICQIAKKHNIFIIEDCAHTHGSKWNDSGAGTLGDFGSYSFQSSKLMNCGEGGALLMQDEDLYWKVVSQRSCGREYESGIKIHSGNYRITSFQAAILLGQLAALRKNASIIDKCGHALDKAIDNSPGVSSLRKNKLITRQCGYAFAFLYNKEAFDGINCADFRNALSAELGITFTTTYTPLSHSEVYYPNTKKRHKLSKSYLNKIIPSRWNLPVAEDLWQNKAVITPWNIFGCSRQDTKLLIDAIEKIYQNRFELLKKIKGK
jgi:L-glutamine:2-deoxy-scyllo-inosose/3-amino-2,3-dideoxy-scyllo-inosose aminotransferase